ncbi:MAG: histidine phosphatase family protein [Solobacterium sp.]|nr:histidine phosphatase family protein [Solobacterium sp.]
MKTIYYYYVRHGETIFNLENRMQGITDSPLTSKGIEQILQTTEALRNQSFNSAYTSPLPRTIQTAKLILEPHHMHVKIFDSLREFSYGSWDGNIKNESDPEYQYRFSNDLFDDLGGENPTMIQQRIQNAFSELRKLSQDQDKVLLVSHGAYFRHLLFSLMKENIPDELLHRECLIGNGGIAVFKDEDGNFSLVEGPLSQAEYMSRHAND